MYPETRKRERQTDREKENATNFFSVCCQSAQFDFFFSASRVKKSGKKRRIVFNSSNTISSPFYCVFVFFTLGLFFSICMRAFGVCKHISMRARVERQKRRKKREAENEWKTHELIYAFSILIIVKKERKKREKGNGIVEEHRGQSTVGKNSRRKKKRNKAVWKYVRMWNMYKNCTHAYTMAIFIYIYILYS